MEPEHWKANSRYFNFITSPLRTLMFITLFLWPNRFCSCLKHRARFVQVLQCGLLLLRVVVVAPRRCTSDHAVDECGNPLFNDGRMESVRNCIDYRSGCRRRLRRFGAITSNDVPLHRGLQDDEDDCALRWKCKDCGYISIIQLLQCAAQTCAVLQQKIDGP